MTRGGGGTHWAGAGARLVYGGLLGLTVISDALPARIRFGHWQRVLRLLRPRRPLACIARPAADGGPAAAFSAVAPSVDHAPRCMIIAGALDGGGVEAVVAALALGLPAEGFDVEVVVTGTGRVSSALAAAGVRVTPTTLDELEGLIARRSPDVIELHRPDQVYLRAVAGAVPPVVPVFHAMESYLDLGTWELLRTVASRAPTSIAVSEGVRDFFSSRLAEARISVVLNGVPEVEPGWSMTRAEARAKVGEAIGQRIEDDDILVVALQRFSDQKNPAGLVDAFLVAACREPRLRLVVAGSPDNWLEYRRAEFVAKGSPEGRRVHLLGDSDAQVILSAGDVYALDSFAEGGPLTAIEAALHGLPLVLSDVGFARELVAQDGIIGQVVERANRGFTEPDLAAVRRRRHQPNRDAFAEAIGNVASGRRGTSGRLPVAFTVDAMVASHAAHLRSALL